MSVVETCSNYIQGRRFRDEHGNQKLLYANESFWMRQENKFVRRSMDEMCDDVLLWMNEVGCVPSNFKFSHIKDIVYNLRAICKTSDLIPGTFLGSPNNTNEGFIPVSNGVLKIQSLLGYMHLELLPHTPLFFAPYILPYQFNERAGCKTFINFLSDTLEEDQIQLLQEWFGYNLLPINVAQKFMIYYGMGANGKSVISLIQRLLLGEENVSCVPLQAFMPNSRFGLASTEGKLANIVEEIDELDSVLAGQFKNYIGGGEISIERKFQSPYKMVPTARLTFSTNSLPRFKDASDGIMRRIMILHFMKQFLNEGLQDKRLIDKNFWIESGELSGILNWSLRGLKRLMRNRWEFTTPRSSSEIIETYKLSTNPAIRFLQDYIETSQGQELPGTPLYQAYRKYCSNNGYSHCDADVFGKYVPRVFPTVRTSKNSLYRQGFRTKVWFGISYKDNPESRVTHLTHENPINLISDEHSGALRLIEGEGCSNVS